MKVIKRINNDALLCIDGNGNRVVALGRDLNDVKRGAELDLSRIDHTFYDVDPRYVDMIRDLPSEYLDIAATVADAARSLLPYKLGPNVDVALADHLAFAVRRVQEGVVVQAPLAYDIRQNYPVEYKIAEYALATLRDRLGFTLPRSELSGIAMCLISGAYAQAGAGDRGYAEQKRLETVLDDITSTVEAVMGTVVDRDGFGYARFITHVQYLINRLESGENIATDNSGMYQALAERNPAAATCADAISLELEHAYGRQPTEEEKLYLILHINRICSCEEADRAKRSDDAGRAGSSGS